MSTRLIIGITVLSLALWAATVFWFWWMHSAGVPNGVLFALGFGGACILAFVPSILVTELKERE